MMSTYLYTDHLLSHLELIGAFAAAFAVEADQVLAFAEDDDEALERAWENVRVEIVVRTATIPGDFPQSLLVHTRHSQPDNFLNIVETAAARLDAPILTDEIGVNPVFDDWLLVAPSGSSAVVSADPTALDRDEPSLELTPESRATYASLVHHPLLSAR